MQTLFFLNVLIVAYTWIGYPAVLLILRWKWARPSLQTGSAAQPSVSIIVAAHNEEKSIAEKLEDTLRLRYPRELLEIIVASDGSTDRTEEAVTRFAVNDSRIRLLRTERAGKSHAQNNAVREAKGDIIFFTDVNTRTRPDLLETIVKNFIDLEVGMVTVTVHFGHPGGAIASGQGLYWRFELFLRAAESAIGILAAGSGQGLALRRSLFRPMPSFYGDDCVLPLDVRLQGYRVVQDAQAVVFDVMPHSIEGELRARVRMTARNWTGTLSRPGLLNPFRFPLTAWALISHKLLRWLTPLFLLFALFCNSLLFFKWPFWLFWIGQVVFYMAALVGWLRTRRSLRAWLFAYPFSFCLANLGFLLGLVKVVRSERITAYQSDG
jgi:cellulose synthase/poly-beta-1,6-N-acetylglucosamine synthase-like glycosyltransferase